MLRVDVLLMRTNLVELAKNSRRKIFCFSNVK